MGTAAPWTFSTPFKIGSHMTKFLRLIILISVLTLAAAGVMGQAINASQKVKERVPDANLSKLADKTTLVRGRVKIVYDGDTVGIEGKDKTRLSIRLQGVDAPESGQSFGAASRENLADLVEGKVVVVIVHEKDSLDRYIGSIFIDGQDIGIKQIEAGMTWHGILRNTVMSNPPSSVNALLRPRSPPGPDIWVSGRTTLQFHLGNIVAMNLLEQKPRRPPPFLHPHWAKVKSCRLLRRVVHLVEFMYSGPEVAVIT